MPVATVRMLGSKMMSSGGKAELVHEQAVGARADADLFVAGGGLALLVEGHDDGGGAVAQEERAAEELGLAVLERDRVDDALALQAFQAGLEHAPLRGVEHHRHARDVGLGGDEVEELHHRRLAVDQRLVDVDVDDVGAVLDLLRAMARQASQSPALRAFANLGEPVMLVRSPMTRKEAA
jgi:hypothetical protein